MPLMAVLLVLLSAVPALRAQERIVSLADETLTYDVIFKWGFINKVAGYATMSLRNDGPYYRASVFAENAPWANSIYMLRDTLYTTMTRDHFYPVSYTFIAHENGKYKKDVLSFSHSGDTFSAKAVRYKKPKKGEMSQSTIELEAQGMTVDMLSSFFYLRTLDFDKMGNGGKKTVNIFSGSKKEKLKITFLGRQQIAVNGNKFDTFYINFTFTRNGTESSAPIKGWITADDRRIPLRVEGKLPVGKVRALYTGPNP